MLKCIRVTVSCVALCGVLSACQDMDFVMIQYQYEQKRDDCRELAEMKYELYSSGNAGNMTSKDAHSALTTLFNDCMASQGWNVSPPPKDGKSQPS